jgi:hypothetical protein
MSNRLYTEKKIQLCRYSMDDQQFLNTSTALIWGLRHVLICFFDKSHMPENLIKYPIDSYYEIL